jgi:hypothetical protein
MLRAQTSGTRTHAMVRRPIATGTALLSGFQARSLQGWETLPRSFQNLALNSLGRHSLGPRGLSMLWAAPAASPLIRMEPVKSHDRTFFKVVEAISY